jgi:hypothetical protein
MGANGRIVREIDRLPGLITPSLGFHRSLTEPIDFCLLQLLPLLFYLDLEFFDLLTEPGYFC